MYKLKVGQAEQYLDIEQNETRLRVPFQIVDGADVILERNESFPLDTSQDDIVATLKRHLAVFTEEQERAADSRKRQEQLDAAQEVAGAISNITID